MFILRGPAAASRMANPDIRNLGELRFARVCAGEPYDYDLHGYMVVVEPGHTVQALEQETGCAILHDLFDDIPFGNPEFTPSYDILEEHHGAVMPGR